jgi:TolB-like protein/tetratricopeptide (TPR) repeat protein
MSTLIRFDGFEVDLAAGRLFKHGSRIRLREQSFQVLAMLLEHPGDVVTREDLRQRLWPTDVFIDFENSLNAAVARLREALGDSAERPRFIETLPKRGYRFIGTVADAVPAPGPAAPARKRLLVLPFVNLTGDPAQEYLSDAVTDEVITELAALAPDILAVIARTTAMRYKGTQKDITRIGRELNVGCVVEGAVRRAGDSVTVNVQLVRANDQAHLWAKRYDSPPGDVFGISGPVAQAVAAALDIGVRSVRGAVGPAGAQRRFSSDPVACNEYVQGRHHLDAGVDLMAGSPRARAHLEKAVARDAGFALAHEALAQMYWMLGYTGTMAPRDAFAAGILHAVRALEIDHVSAEARALVAQYYKQLDYSWPDIERELSGALALNPASSLVRMLYAVSWLMPQGRMGEAIAELERAAEWDPQSYQVQMWLTIVVGLSRDYDRLIEQSRLLIELEPAGAAGHWQLMAGFRGKGMLDEAVATQRKAVDLSGSAPLMVGWLGLMLGISGRADEARGVLERLETMARARYVPPSMFAFTYLGLRDVDRAFEWLDRAVDARDQIMMPIKSYVFFDPIRADPRFHALLRKMKLEG